MSHAVEERPSTHAVSRADKMKIFDRLPVVHIPEGFSSPEEIKPDPHADDHHHHEDHSEQDREIHEILGESPVAAVSNGVEAVIARIAAPAWYVLGKLGIHVY